MRKQYHFRSTSRGRLIWDVDRLLKLAKDLKVKEISIESITELDENFWFQNEEDLPTCRAVADHAKLIEEADLYYPIILSSDGRVMDGMHRVAKAYIQDKKTIRAVQFDEDPEPDYVDVNLEDLPY